MARTHTGALAGDDAAYRALFDRYGVVRVDTLDELAATLLLLSHPARPGAGGLASIHDSGGECELLIDLAADIGVPLARINDETRATLSKHLDPGLEPVNPLDAWGVGHNAVNIFENCLEALMADPDTAAAVVVSDIRDGHYHHRNLAQVARTAVEKAAMPLAFVTNYSLVGHREIALELTEFGVPVLDGTREALQAFRHLFDYRDFLARPKSAPPARPTAEVTKRWQERLCDPKLLDEV
jgi:acyl-CoA synthetase (NDP forming)